MYLSKNKKQLKLYLTYLFLISLYDYFYGCMSLYLGAAANCKQSDFRGRFYSDAILEDLVRTLRPESVVGRSRKHVICALLDWSKHLHTL